MLAPLKTLMYMHTKQNIHFLSLTLHVIPNQALKSNFSIIVI